MSGPPDSKAQSPGYRTLLRTPKAWAFVVPGLAARQPLAMLTISMVLLVRHATGSYGTAGAAAAITGASMALCAPRSGRLADRYGQRAVLLPAIALHALSVLGVVALAATGITAWWLLAAAVPVGATVPQIGPMVRARWAVALDDPSSPLMQTAAAFESVSDEFTFVVGPVLATALCTGVHPAAGLVAEASLTVAGGALFAAQRLSEPPAHRVSASSGVAHASALSLPGVRALVVAFLGVGAVFGGMQVSLAAFTQEIDRPGLNGVLYGMFAAGNMLAGAAYGAVSWRHGPRTRLLAAYAGLTVACAPLWAAHSLALLSVLPLIAGAFIGPTIVTAYSLVDALVPRTVRTEAFTWLTGAVAFGQAIAVTVAGLLTDAQGSSAGFAVPLAGTALALAVLAGLRAHLLPHPAGRAVTGGIGHRPPVSVD
ncbi:Predicted arabinose efflux permease, MFS family [Actinacidiphila yanglinensis]|uniref:Predicted arabinose efflux permease, MFS family n=2 Tax=Actinacidiphila yanglinensis TaxID=310779 RepID=A0A1H5ZFD8_9ACTN|nr:MFS transporter [Actinacidiphila yanglinensis]SEG34445.1 Predicted arabinose efflux permease, MFS family [Actinacidiphila yanglinensis]